MRMNEIQLEECPRIQHSLDMPLKYPRKNCALRSMVNQNHCMFTPCVARYCEAKGIKYDFGTTFLCVKPIVESEI